MAADIRSPFWAPGYKFNADRRDKIAKQKLKVTNWAAYNESLRQRGDLTIWVSDEALSLWSASRRTSRRGQPKYSDLAITMCLTLRVVYGLPLRQTQGLMRSIATLMNVTITAPDFSTLSRRSKGLALPSTRPGTRTSGPVHLVVDSTGLKVFGEGEWLEKKHCGTAEAGPRTTGLDNVDPDVERRTERGHGVNDYFLMSAYVGRHSALSPSLNFS